MTLSEAYSLLNGSHGTFRLQLSPTLLDQICVLIKPHVPLAVRDIRISPSGQNRFRVFADLSRQLFQWLGSSFLNVLHEEGLEIEITQPVATPAQPWMHGRLQTTLVGKRVAQVLIRAINQALASGEDVLSVATQWFSGEVAISLNPFPLLRLFLPVAIIGHFTQVRLTATATAVILEFDWHNCGVMALPVNHRGGNSMDPQLQAFLNNLVQSRFVDLKGSSARLSLQLPEQLLNELLDLALHSQQPAIPWLGLVRKALVKGAVQVEAELQV